MNADEEKIWRSIQQKDSLVFESFYKGHYKYFFLAAFNHLRDAGRAEEIVNDVFVNLWQKSDTIRVETSLKSYVYRSVINRSLNELDKTRRELERQKQLGHRPEDTPEWKGMEDNELKLRLYKAIDGLPEQCRKVFTMSRFEDLKQQEIADRLNISLKTVKNHINYALKQLNKVLSDWNTLPLWIIMLRELF